MKLYVKVLAVSLTITSLVACNSSNYHQEQADTIQASRKVPEEPKIIIDQEATA